MGICESKIPNKDIEDEVKNKVKDELEQELKSEIKRQTKGQAIIEVKRDQKTINVNIINKVMKAVCKIIIKSKKGKISRTTGFL